MADPQGSAQPVRDRLAVPEAIAGRCFERVTECVAEVECHPNPSRVAFVGQDQPAFRQCASLDDFEQLRWTRPRPLSVAGWTGFEQRQKRVVADQAVFDGLGKGRMALLDRFVSGHVDIEDRCDRLVDRTEEITTDAGQIHATLATDRRVDEAERRHRNSDERDPPQIDRRRKRDRLEQDIIADRDQRIATFKPEPRQRLQEPFLFDQPFRRFTLW